ncbi:MAG TPA: ATP-binding protein [Solirubrobacteraceae bacterium]|nr:ATP-binding protein [Solirubrobacteraceae bacterium]
MSFAGETETQRAERCELGLCDGSGFVVDEATDTASDCPCRAGRIARRRAAGLEGRIPRHYRGVSFERPPVPEIARVAPDVVQAIRRYVRDIDTQLDAGQGLWLMGDVGTGKTTLAMIVSKAAIEAGRSVAIYSLPRLLNLIRAAIETDDGMVGFLERLAAVDLLHIDDLGAENTTEWVLEQLYSIVNTRYEDERAMIVTTNLNYEELVEQLGERTVSRLVAICGNGLPLFGQDDRRQLPRPAERAAPAPDSAPADIWGEVFGESRSG